VSRETENVLLLLVGMSGVLIVATGTYTRYVKPTLMPWLLAGAVVVLVLACASIVADVRSGGTHHGGHAHRSPVLWLLAVPVVVLVSITPPAIGAHASDAGAAAASAAVRRPFPPLPAGDAPEVSLPDVLIRVAQDSAGTLDGRLVTVSGFVLRRGDQVDLGRVVIICCAADATLARIPLSGPGAPEAARYADDTWVQVEGRVTPGPALNVVSVSRIEAPANTYAY
jgi:uncharacterized repeat protein (TIGR03943 family)